MTPAAHALWLLFLVAPSGVPDGPGSVASTTQAALDWSAGERLEFAVDVGLLAGAASVQIETLPSATGRQPGLRLLGTVQPGPLIAAFYPFSYRHLSTLSDDGLLPLNSSRQTQEDDQQWFVALSYRHADGQVRLAESAHGPAIARDAIAGDTQDLLSAVHHLRHQDPAAGSRFSVYENRRLYTVTHGPARPEVIDVPAGSFPAWHFTLEVAGAEEDLTRPDIELWISQADRRLPLRLTASTRFGELRLELTEWEVRPLASEPGKPSRD